jgi:formylglycine-generating enzyme required for sulfatase activity
MVKVEGGTFGMGCSSDTLNCEKDEYPLHTVAISDFYISKYEITNKQFCKFLNEKGVEKTGKYDDVELIDMDLIVGPSTRNACQIKYKEDKFIPLKGKENHPVIAVTYYGAIQFCEWAGGRLPTEAEWEYAARGGSKSIGYIFSGSNELDRVAWWKGNSGGHSHKVGKKQPNELYIYDMTGNVLEWCSDWYNENYYKSSQRNNPQGGISVFKVKVLRGGSFMSNHDKKKYRVSNRYHWGISSVPTSHYYIGFRLVRD